MATRPKATDTEEDLLAFQSSFLSSGERPAASLKRKAGESSSIGGGSMEGVKDVVRLSDEGKPQVKKSKFKERREKMKQRKQDDEHMDPHEAMDSQDMHITKVLADIQERGFHVSTVLPQMTTKHGFPIAPQLNLDLEKKKKTSAGDASSSGDASGIGKEKKKKKSLFAEQFEGKDMSFFGIDSTSSFLSSVTSSQRDCVEPIFVSQITGRESPDLRRPGAMETGSRFGDVDDPGDVMVEDHFSSTASQTWERMRSSFVSGEGLEVLGGSEEAVKSDLEKIHHENVDRLSRLSASEVMLERAQIEKALGPDLVAFLKKTSGQKLQTKDKGSSGAMSKGSSGTVSCPTLLAEGMSAAPPLESPAATQGLLTATTSSLVPPGMEWLHMDVLEKDKLEWTADVPSARSQPDMDRADSRFSLDGVVISRSEEVPFHLGLHHHGDEPEAAGYTLSELLPLCRSSVRQQRVLSLQTLAKIIRREQQGEYKDTVSGSVVDRLKADGAPLVFRYALDEAIEPVVMAAVQAMHALLVMSQDQVILDEYILCYSGEHVPALKPHPLPPRKKEEGEEEESDFEILQRDIIEGYLRMSLLPRVRYILEVFLPGGPVVLHIQLLEILTLVAKHSTGAATKVLDCPRLMGVVFQQYLPLSWSGTGSGALSPSSAAADSPSPSGHGRPKVAALHLVRSMCVAGKNVSSQLVLKHSLLSVLTSYTALHPSEMNLPLEEAYQLVTVSLGVWQVLLRYGLGGAVFRDTFPVLLSQLHALPSVSASTSSESKRIAALLGLVESAFCFAAGGEGGGALLAPAVKWSQVAGMLPPLLQTLTLWTKAHVISQPNMNMLLSMGSLLNVVATYYEKLKLKVGSKYLVETLQKVEELVSSVVEVLPQSAFFSMWSGVIGDHGSGIAFTRRTNFLHGFVRLCYSLSELHKGMLERVSGWVLSPAHQEYMQQSMGGNGGEPPLVSYLWVQVVYNTLKLFIAWGKGKESGRDRGFFSFFFEDAFHLFVSVPSGLGDIASYVLSNVLFNPAFHSASESTLPSANLISIKDTFVATLGRRLISGKSSTSLLLPPKAILVPSDWIFFPIVLEYDRTLIVAKKSSSGSEDIKVSRIKHALSYLLLLEQSNPKLLANMNLSTKLARLMCVFLIDDIFLDPDIHALLEKLLCLYCEKKKLSALDFSAPIPGVQSFTELYKALLEQFSASSYGDHLFCCFILLPLQQKQPVALRRLLWEENPQVLRFLSIPLDKLPLKVKSFLHPLEKDKGILETYRACLAMGTVSEKWCPLLYKVAVHHIQAAAT